jgi:uncharacterized metal-binding protein
VSIFIVAIAQLFFGFTWNWHDFTRQQLNLLRKQYLTETTAVFLGLELGAMSHSISDWISSRQKQLQKKSPNKIKVKR